MTTQHTPGPWKYDGSPRYSNGQPNGDHHHISSKTEYPIFTVLCGRPEARANARLIAAVPELLEAAKDALEVINEIAAITITAPPCGETASALQAAIAKATSKE